MIIHSMSSQNLSQVAQSLGEDVYTASLGFGKFEYFLYKSYIR